jgi:hypothetical protein
MMPNQMLLVIQVGIQMLRYKVKTLVEFRDNSRPVLNHTGKMETDFKTKNSTPMAILPHGALANQTSTKKLNNHGLHQPIKVIKHQKNIQWDLPLVKKKLKTLVEFRDNSKLVLNHIGKTETDLRTKS